MGSSVHRLPTVHTVDLYLYCLDPKLDCGMPWQLLSVVSSGQAYPLHTCKTRLIRPIFPSLQSTRHQVAIDFFYGLEKALLAVAIMHAPGMPASYIMVRISLHRLDTPTHTPMAFIHACHDKKNFRLLTVSPAIFNDEILEVPVS